MFQSKKNDVASVEATVRSIRETLHANNTPAMSRIGSLANSVSTYRGSFSLADGDELTLVVPDKLAGQLRPGMRGVLKYRELEVISFEKK